MHLSPNRGASLEAARPQVRSIVPRGRSVNTSENGGGRPSRDSLCADELRELMEEPPGGENHGRSASDDPERLGRWLPLGVGGGQHREFLMAGGWSIVEPGAGGAGARAGMTAHRGVLRGDEYVDARVLRLAIEEQLGFTL